MCVEQEMLLNEERRAWSEYKRLRDSGIQDKNEITKKADDAGLVSAQLREHIHRCRRCQAQFAGFSTRAAVGF